MVHNEYFNYIKTIIADEFIMTFCSSLIQLETTTTALCKGKFISRTFITSSTNLRKNCHTIQHFENQCRFYGQFNNKHPLPKKLICHESDSCKRRYSDDSPNRNSFSVLALKYGPLFVIFHGSCSLICTAVAYVLITRLVIKH